MVVAAVAHHYVSCVLSCVRSDASNTLSKAFHYDQSEDGIAPGAPENTEDTSPLIPKVRMRLPWFYQCMCSTESCTKVAKVLNVGEEILGESRKVFLEKADEPKELEFKQVDKVICFKI